MTQTTAVKAKILSAFKSKGVAITYKAKTRTKVSDLEYTLTETTHEVYGFLFDAKSSEEISKIYEATTALNRQFKSAMLAGLTIEPKVGDHLTITGNNYEIVEITSSLPVWGVDMMHKVLVYKV